MVETGHKFYDNLAKRIAWAHWFTLFNLIAISISSPKQLSMISIGLGKLQEKSRKKRRSLSRKSRSLSAPRSGVASILPKRLLEKIFRFRTGSLKLPASPPWSKKSHSDRLSYQHRVSHAPLRTSRSTWKTL